MDPPSIEWLEEAAYAGAQMAKQHDQIMEALTAIVRAIAALRG